MAQYTPNIEFIIINTSVKPNEKFYLDVENVTDFPLALTYSIKDVQDPSSSKGSYSKTFSIPATGNNNTTLKNLYSESLYDSHQYVEDYDALIFVDGMCVLEGKFQIKGTKYKGIPKSYDCQVFGENFKWVNALAELNLCDIDFTAGNFFPNAPLIATFAREDIMDTWKFGEAGEVRSGIQTHIIYPLISTGKWNFEDPVTGEGIPTPSDMSPAFYFYNMLKCIFAAQGYTLDSKFFETSWFKRLLTFIPMEQFVNTPDIITSYSFEVENNSATPWKTPVHYTNMTSAFNSCSGVIGNTWHGQSYGLTPVCALCDPSGQITDQDVTPFFDPYSPFDVDSFDETDAFHFAGWYPFNYSPFNYQTLFQSKNTAWRNSYNSCYNFNPNIPNTNISMVLPYSTYGVNYFCVHCDPWASSLPASKEVSMDDTSMFQTTYLGLYEFSGSMEIEMDNKYALDNDIAPFDHWTYNPTQYYAAGISGTNMGGFGFPEIQYYGSYPIYTGVVYDFNLYLMHYKHSTKLTHIVHGEAKRLKEPTNNQGVGYYNFNYLLDANNNLIQELSFSGIQVDVLDPEDRVYMYCEVTSTAFVKPDTLQIEKIGQCQMKYRALKQSFEGTIDPSIIAGGSVDLELLLPCDTSQLEWVNGLTGLFNLSWQSNEQTKTIIVEPRDEFFKHYTEAENWTDKLDHGQDQDNEYIYNALKRNLCFTYENDSADGLVEERNRRRGQVCELGSHALNLGDLYLNEEQKIGSDYYSPTYMFYDKSVSNNQGSDKQPFIPLIHGEYSAAWTTSLNVDLPDKITDFNPRILTWYGLQPLNQVDGQTSANTWRWGYDNLSSPHENKKNYPFAGVYSDQVGNLGGSLTIGGINYNSPSLYFERSDINVVATPAPYDQTNGLYQMFWESHILSLVDRPVIKTAFFKLTPADIANLDYRKLIYLEGAQADTYWILNKITDYKAGSNQLTKVELFEYSNTRGVTKASMKKGFGSNLTPQWTDYNAQAVAFGIPKVANKYLSSKLDIADETFINIPTNQIQKTINVNQISNFLELTKNGDFTETTDWTGANFLIKYNKCKLSVGIATPANIEQNISYVDGKQYSVLITLDGDVGNSIIIEDDNLGRGNLNSTITLKGDTQTIRLTWNASSSSSAISIRSNTSADFVFFIDKISILEVEPLTPLQTIYANDGTRIPTQLGSNSGNIGQNKNIGIGGISIGNNINNSTGSHVTIGEGNFPFASNPISITQNGRCRLGISNSGLMLEGGGGVVYYENPSGEVQEVITGIPLISYGGTPKFEYARCVLADLSEANLK